MAKKNTNSAVADAPETVEAPYEPGELTADTIKALTVEQIAALDRDTLNIVDSQSHVLDADQLRAVADAIRAGFNERVKELRKTAKQKEKGENLAEWQSFLDAIGGEILEAFEETHAKRGSFVSVRVYRNSATDELTVKSGQKSRRYEEGETAYVATNRENGNAPESSGETTESPDGDSLNFPEDREDVTAVESGD